MIKIFITTFFIAELIITFSLLFWIWKLDKAVNNINKNLSENKENLKNIFKELQDVFSKISLKIAEIKALIKHKKEEYILQTLKTTLIYSSLFFLRGRYQKTILAYQIIREIYDGFKEAEA